MGWTFMRGKPRDERIEVERLFTPADPANVTMDVLQLVKRGSVWYGAIRTTVKGQEPVVWAAIIKTQVYRGDWGYKDMDETCGPYHWDAPLSLLDKLSPTDNAYALEWRAEVRVKAATKRKPIKPGQILVAKQPIDFGVFKASRFQKVDMPRKRNVFRALDAPGGPTLVRLNYHRDLLVEEETA